MAVEGRRQVQTPEGGPQDREIGHGFHTQQAGFGGVHPSSLPTPARLAENYPQHERTVGSISSHTPVRIGVSPSRMPRHQSKGPTSTPFRTIIKGWTPA